MKKCALVFVMASLAVFFGCKENLYNTALKRKGLFNDTIHLAKVKKGDKEIVYIPMQHIGTVLFYKDVKHKIDSLKNNNYFFYLEKVNVEITDTISIRKFKKMTNIPMVKNGYMDSMDSIVKTKLKKELINQPTYEALGLDSLNSKNVDVSLKDMISYYESNFSEIILEPCDYKTSIYNRTDCKNFKKNTIFETEIIYNFRDKHIVDEIQNDNHNKIAIIYGKNHFIGITKRLMSLGYYYF